ncbi:oncostatin-M [Talpa occidentalis]|uniref:oncostatin-M n=1 Tax=Talpa occidentalis TaxID=50954 RepID=UPI00188F0BAC|nr:oncostatin-M [Talpa occidentalis]
MWAQLTWRTLLSLVLRLLLLSAAAMGGCSGKYHELLRQLQHQADFMKNRNMLLEPYIHIQGLDVSGLQEHCKEHPGAFLSEDALWGLSRQSFLQTLDTRLGHILHRLKALQQGLPKAEFLRMGMLNIRGFRNNIHCMAQLFPDTSEATKPTQAGPLDLPSATPTSDAFQRKLEGCRFLSGYHRFMHSVGQVFRGWRPSLSRNRRHSPHLVLRKGAQMMQPSRKGQRPVPGMQLPR